MRVNEVIITKIEGASDSTVTNAISWITRSVSPPAPPPEVPSRARQRAVRRAAVRRRAPQGSSPDGAVLLPAVVPSGQGSGRHRRRTPARRRGIVADLTVADSVIANLAIVGRAEAP